MPGNFLYKNTYRILTYTYNTCIYCTIYVNIRTQYIQYTYNRSHREFARICLIRARWSSRMDHLCRSGGYDSPFEGTSRPWFVGACMCSHVYVLWQYIHIFLNICMYIQVCVYTCMCMYLCVLAFILRYLYVYTSISVHARMHVYACIYIMMFVYSYNHICM